MKQLHHFRAAFHNGDCEMRSSRNRLKNGPKRPFLMQVCDSQGCKVASVLIWAESPEQAVRDARKLHGIDKGMTFTFAAQDLQPG